MFIFTREYIFDSENFSDADRHTLVKADIHGAELVDTPTSLAAIYWSRSSIFTAIGVQTRCRRNLYDL